MSERSPEIQDGQIYPDIFCKMYIERYRRLAICCCILHLPKILPPLGDYSLLHCLDDNLVFLFV